MLGKQSVFRASLIALLVMIFSGGSAKSGKDDSRLSSEERTMYSFFVAINVKPEHQAAFVDASITVGQATVKEERGVFRYDVLRDADNPNRFYFYEIFRDKEAAEAHWETGHFKTWWSTVENMVDGEFDRISTMRPVFPSTEGLERQRPSLLRW